MASVDVMSQTLSTTMTESRRGSGLPSEVLNLSAVSESSEHRRTEVEELYEAIVCDPRYFQFARIPDRIIRCLELCGISCERAAVTETLQSYYLFIGVVDDELEFAEAELGEKILNRFEVMVPFFDDETRRSRAHFMTEIVKRHITSSSRAQVLRKLRRLHRVSIKERQVRTMKDYVKQRKLVGSLTAELSYLLIATHLCGESASAGKLMKDIGAVGCLVDSIVDAGADKRSGLLSFRPTFFGAVSLYTHTLLLGMALPLRHPRLLSLFVEAIRDNFYDRRRSLAT